MSKLDGVEDTLFIPLVGRIYSSKHYKEFFYDEKALELEQYIPSKLIEENSDEYFTMAALSRFVEFDTVVKEFIKKNKQTNIICLGAGLETMYFRIKPDNNTTFYEVDFPNVIKQRNIALGEHENERLIGCDILDFKWMDEINKDIPTLFIVSGVFQYLHKEDILKLINTIKNKFNKAELAFDATNKPGLRKANEYVQETGNTNAMMYFYVDKVNDFVKESNTTLIRVIPFFKRALKVLKKKLTMKTKFTCFFGDKLGYSKIIYVKIK